MSERASEVSHGQDELSGASLSGSGAVLDAQNPGWGFLSAVPTLALPRLASTSRNRFAGSLLQKRCTSAGVWRPSIARPSARRRAQEARAGVHEPLPSFAKR